MQGLVFTLWIVGMADALDVNRSRFLGDEQVRAAYDDERNA